MVNGVMASGRTGIAPCGHTGECIIGTYYRCLQGCDSGTKMIARRGEPGHVEACACKPCQIRRRAAYIKLSTKTGDAWVQLAWDGISNKIRWTSAWDGQIRNWKMLDDNDAEIASGTLDAVVKENWKLVLDIELLIDASAKLYITRGCHKCGNALKKMASVFGTMQYCVAMPGEDFEAWKKLHEVQDVLPPVVFP